MEKKTMGVFLAALRKTHGYTQQEVADKLNISNKTVSKWERDEGCPEIMMLPAIAELYGVTVDEILRGERIAKAETEQINEEKTEKRIKYLFEKSLSKYTNLSIIAITLGVLASILAFLTWELSYTYATITVCIILALLMCCASVIVQIVAFNNFRLNFTDEENIIDEHIAAKAMKKSLVYLGTVIGLVIVTVTGVIVNFIHGLVPYAFIPISIFVGGGVAFIIYTAMCRKMNITKTDATQLSPEFLAYRKKHIKKTAVFISVVMIFCLLFPFAQVIYSSVSTLNDYSFSEAAEYNYESFADAENDYNKLKDFFLNGKTLYKKDIGSSIIDPESADAFFVYKLTANCTDAEFDADGNVISADYDIYTEAAQNVAFDTYEESEEFTYRQCWTNTDLSPYDLTKNVSFNDADMSVNYTSPIDFSLVFDILPVFLIIACSSSSASAIISFIIYINKRKKSTNV